MSDDNDNDLPIVSLDAYRIERGSRYCRHLYKVIEPNQRLVLCKDCKASLDLFECLHEIARERDNMIFRRRELRRQIAELEARLADMKRNEANTRARLKTLSKKKVPLTGVAP